MKIRQFVHNNSLAVAVFSIFILAIGGMSITGWLSNNNSLEEHHQTQLSYASYVTSGEFIEGVFENWESEFLQMWALIILTKYLRQKGSADSKPLRGSMPQDTNPRYSIIGAKNWQQRKKAVKHSMYGHSLGLVMFLFFATSILFHAIGGAAAYNQENIVHGSETVSVIGYATSSQFWYESLQNWQSEFLAIGTLLVLSIKLRERGSPESKPVGKKFDHKTG